MLKGNEKMICGKTTIRLFLTCNIDKFGNLTNDEKMEFFFKNVSSTGVFVFMYAIPCPERI